MNRKIKIALALAALIGVYYLKINHIKTTKVEKTSLKNIKQEVSKAQQMEQRLIFEAIENNDLKTVTQQLSQGFNPNIRFNKRNFTLLMDATKNCNEALVLTLLQYGANPNLTDTHGNTALHYAATNGSVACVRILLENNASNSTVNLEGMRPIDLARKYQNDLVINLLEGK